MARFQQHDFEQQLHELIESRLCKFQTPIMRDCALKSLWDTILQDKRVKIPQMRFRWDLLYSTDSPQRSGLMNQIYEAGFDDTHVDRSLHRFCKVQNLAFYPQEYNGK